MTSYIIRRVLLMIPTVIGITLLAYMVMAKARESKYQTEYNGMMGFLDSNKGAEGGSSGGAQANMSKRYPSYEKIERLDRKYEYDVPFVFNTEFKDRNERLIDAFKGMYAKIPELKVEDFRQLAEKRLEDNKALLSTTKKSEKSFIEKEIKILTSMSKALAEYEKTGANPSHKWSHEDALKNQMLGNMAAIDNSRVAELKKAFKLIEPQFDKRTEFRKRRDSSQRYLAKFKTSVNAVLAEELSSIKDDEFKAFIFSYMPRYLNVRGFKDQADFDTFWKEEVKKIDESHMREQVNNYIAFKNPREDKGALDIFKNEFMPRASIYVPLFFRMFDEFNDYHKKRTLLDLFETFADCDEISYYDIIGAEELVSMRNEAEYWYHNRDNYLNFENLSSAGNLRCFFLNTSYGRWIRDVCEWEFRGSDSLGQPVLECVKKRLPISMRFGIVGFLLAYTVCIPLGIMKALKHNSQFDVVSSIFVFIGYSIPGWAFGSILLSIFAGQAAGLQWFPLGGANSPADELANMSTWEYFCDTVHHSILPVMAYAIGSFTTLTILMKNSLMENLGADYLRTAFAKGLSERRVIFVHCLRNSLIPLCTGLGHMISVVLAGSYLIEKVFEIPGFGLMGFEALMDFDINLLMGVLLISSILMVVGNLLSDILYSLVDPRVRFK